VFSVLQTPNYGIFQVVDGKLIDVSGVGLVTSPPVSPLDKEGGKIFERGAWRPSNITSSPYSKGKPEGANAPSGTILSPSLDKGGG